MSVSVGLNQKLLTQGERFYAYSGVVQGDISVPASISLLSFSNGLRDAFVKIQPFQGQPIATGVNDGLGITILIDGVEVYKDKERSNYNNAPSVDNQIELFVPRQSTIEVQSINTANNNTQDRGVLLLGWYLA